MRRWMESKKLSCDALHEVTQQHQNGVVHGFVGNLAIALVNGAAQLLNFDFPGGYIAQHVALDCKNNAKYSVVSGFTPMPY